MNIFFRIALALISLAFGSCSSSGDQKLTVIVHENDSGRTLVFDKDRTLLTNGMDSILLTPGRHEYQFGAESQAFTMPGKDALLNLSGQDLVLVSITFEPENEADKFSGAVSTLRPNFIIVDSFLIFKRPFLAMLQDPDTLRHIITKVLEAADGNYAPLSKNEELMEGRGYDSDQKVWGFKKISADRKLIPKFWDYDLGQKIPEYISVRRSKEGVVGSFPENRIMLLFAEDFLDHAESMPGTYEVVDISDHLFTLKQPENER